MTAIIIFKICHADEWRAAEVKGHYDGSAKDKADGFLHFSTAEQLAGTLARYYKNEAGLVLVAVSVCALGDALKWEKSRDGALFPHLYAPLTIKAVQWSAAIARDGKEGFILPSSVTQP